MDQLKMHCALKSLARTIATITPTFDMDALLQGILDACIVVTPARRGALYLVDKRSTEQELALRAQIGFAHNTPVEVRQPVPSDANEEERSKLESVYMEKRTIILDASQIAALPNQQSRLEPLHSDTDPLCRGWAGIPICSSDGTTIGVITLQDLDAITTWKESLWDAREFLFSLAGSVADAMAKATDYHDRLFAAVRDLVDDFGREGDLEHKIINVLKTFDRIAGASGSSIWLINGTRLTCRYATGHYERVLEKDAEGYDLSPDPEKTRIGLTAWIATSGEFVHTKMQQKHPQYLGRLDSVLYDPRSPSQSFLGAPLRDQGEIIGVIKSNKLSGPDGENCFFTFTEEDAQQFRFLALIAAGAVKISRDIERARGADQTVIKLYEIGTKCHELTNTNEILWYFLVGLTHARGIGVNRAAWLDVKDIDGQVELRGRMAIGPVDPSQGREIHKRIDVYRDRSDLALDQVLGSFRAHDFRVPTPEEELQSVIEGLSMKVDGRIPILSVFGGK